MSRCRMPRECAACSALAVAMTMPQASAFVRPVVVNFDHTVPPVSISITSRHKPVLIDEVEHRDDVRMVERRKQPCLLHEPHLDRRVLAEAERQLLDGDGSPELAVLAGDDDAHGAAAELGADVVGRQGVRDLLEVGIAVVTAPDSRGSSSQDQGW